MITLAQPLAHRLGLLEPYKGHAKHRFKIYFLKYDTFPWLLMTPAVAGRRILLLLAS
jgi:hypothetical protein